MADLIIHDLEPDVAEWLTRHAARTGVSLEEAARRVLSLRAAEPGSLSGMLAKRFEGIGLRPGEELPELRGQAARPAEF